MFDGLVTSVNNFLTRVHASVSWAWSPTTPFITVTPAGDDNGIDPPIIRVIGFGNVEDPSGNRLLEILAVQELGSGRYIIELLDTPDVVLDVFAAFP